MKNPPKKQRRFDLDWLRVLAFSLLIFYHVGMFFNYWEWIIKNDDLSHAISWPMRFTNQWRMALLFMISGSAIYLALQHRPLGSFLKERVVRILIPLVFGMLVIVPPQIFFERLTLGDTNSYAEFYKSVFQFTPYHEGNVSWYHLWYLAHIFFYSFLALPAMLYLRSNDKLTLKLAQIFSNPFLLIMVPVIWHVAGDWLLSDRFLTPHILSKEWNNHFHSLTLFVTGFLFCTQTLFWKTLLKYRWLTTGLWMTLTTILFAFYWTGDKDVTSWEIPFYWLIKITNAWCILLAIFGHAYKYLQFSNPFLRYANEAVYPFYILHQTVIICLAYPLIHASMPIYIKFMYLCLATFVICLVLYHLVIRNINPLRVVFGLKMKQTKPSKVTIPISSIS